MLCYHLHKRHSILILHSILSDASVEWAKPLGVLNTALELSKVIASRTAAVEAEILLNMGQ